MANGGTSIEDPPGIRDAGFGKMYLAYLRDPDGNKLCGFYRMPKESAPASPAKGGEAMFTHVHLGSNDVERSKRFYDALFDALGGAHSWKDMDRNRWFWAKGGQFLVLGHEEYLVRGLGLQSAQGLLRHHPRRHY